MCRLLYVRSNQPLPLAELLRPFAAMSRDSREYQGHGWGCAWRENDQWRTYHNIEPVWQDELDAFPSGGADVEDREVDPVSVLLGIVHRLAENGIGFEQSLGAVSGLIESSALRHAFIHLGVAHREGGELVMPLKELSDSTQLYFQETIESEIAKLPVKATMPLLCTFAGLIIIFVTTPLIQVIGLAGKTEM